MATRCVTLELTSEQTDAIKTLFQQHDWKYCEMKSTNGHERNGKRKRTKCVSTAGVAMSANGDGSGDPGNQNDDPDPDGDKKREQAQRQNIVYWKREIMPECVLSFARGLYPNPDGQPYMGHKWE